MDEYSAWDLVDPLEAGVAACLWCEVSPSAPFHVIKAQHPAVVAIVEMFINAILDNTIKNDRPNVSWSGDLAWGDGHGIRITRKALRELAIRRGQRPIFLFPEDHGRQVEPSYADLNTAQETIAVPMPVSESVGADSSATPIANHAGPQINDPAKEHDPAQRAASRVRQQSRSMGKYSPLKLREWYTQWVSENQAIGKIPSRDDDVSEAKAKFSIEVPRDAVRALRRELAPANWHARGRPKSSRKTGGN